MYVKTHPAHILLRADESYNPRNLQIRHIADRQIIEGVCIDDGARNGNPRRPNRPFRINVPTWFNDWTRASTALYYALRQPGPIYLWA
jgi:hypothetical protein